MKQFHYIFVCLFGIWVTKIKISLQFRRNEQTCMNSIHLSTLEMHTCTQTSTGVISRSHL